MLQAASAGRTDTQLNILIVSSGRQWGQTCRLGWRSIFRFVVMDDMKPKILVLSVISVCVLGLSLGYWFRPSAMPARTDLNLSGLKFANLSGATVEVAAISEPVLILNFWATWCPPCSEELPSLLKLVRSNPGKIRVIAFSQDEDETKIPEFLARFGEIPKGFEIVYDRDRSLAKRFGVEKLPESFILDRKRRLARKIDGYDDWSTAGAVAYFNLLFAE
jgi:cytochrome c biogenesis protein CcmG, thiol:disulfide interchange protein DsbE